MSNVDGLAAEIRAVESGAHSFREDGGVYRVRSFSTEGVRYAVTPSIVKRDGRYAIHLACTCQAGTTRPSQILSCQHGALVGRRLEREGRAVWEGRWWEPTNITLGRAGLLEAKPKTRTMHGSCGVCHAFVTVEVADDQEPATVAASHRPECEQTYAKRCEQAAKHPDLDLWDRSGGLK